MFFGPREHSLYLKNNRLADRGVVLQFLARVRDVYVMYSVQTELVTYLAYSLTRSGNASSEAKRPAVKLSNHFLLVPGLKWMEVPYNSTSLMTSWSVQENLDVLGRIRKQEIKEIKSFVMSVLPSFRQKQLDLSWKYLHEISYWELLLQIVNQMYFWLKPEKYNRRIPWRPIEFGDSIRLNSFRLKKSSKKFLEIIQIYFLYQIRTSKNVSIRS